MAKTFWKIWNGMTTLLVLAVVVLAGLLVLPQAFGMQVFSVLSGSMEPTYQTGSVIYVKAVDTQQLQVGDVITYMLSEETVATHRIAGIEVDEEGVTRFRTKGDANEVEDAVMVHEANVLGTPVYSIPYLGQLASFIRSSSGKYTSISVAAMIALLVVVPDLFAKEPDKKKKEEPKGPEAPAEET